MLRLITGVTTVYIEVGILPIIYPFIPPLTPRESFGSTPQLTIQTIQLRDGILVNVMALSEAACIMVVMPRRGADLEIELARAVNVRCQECLITRA